MKLTRCHKISWFFFTTSLKAYLTIIMDGKMALGFLIGDAIPSKYYVLFVRHEVKKYLLFIFTFHKLDFWDTL